MARRLRDQAAGTFHVYAHSVWAASMLFRDDTDRVCFLRELARATAKVQWRCLAYCLMGTHYHLIVDVDDGVLSSGMHAINFRYACSFNGRHRLRGHVFGARYDARRIRGDAELATVFRYVARNPVEARLCASPADWPWSSYAAIVGSGEPSTFVEAATVLDCFGDELELARARLRSFVESREDDVTGPGPRRVRTASSEPLANGREKPYIPD